MEVSLVYIDVNFRQWENKTRESSELALLLHYSGYYFERKNNRNFMSYFAGYI